MGLYQIDYKRSENAKLEEEFVGDNSQESAEAAFKLIHPNYKVLKAVLKEEF